MLLIIFEMPGANISSRIIRDSYLKVDSSERPKIFGMTASPIDGKANVIEAARYVSKVSKNIDMS